MTAPNSPTPDTRERAWTDAQKSGPQVVCCVCGEPCSIYLPACAKCTSEMLAAIGDKP